MLYEHLMETEAIIKKARKSGLDMSVEYPDNENSAGYKLQQELRILTMSLNVFYLSFSCCDQEISDGILNALKQVRDLFGNHPFHHVMDGRLTKSVQRAYNEGLKIPKKLQHYKDFKINPWNNPHLNYNTPKDIIRCVKKGSHGPEHLSEIPPEWLVSQISC